MNNPNSRNTSTQQTQRNSHLERAERHLELPHNEAPWITDYRYVNMGKRPMKNYPLVYLTSGELAHIIHLYTELSLPEKYWRSCFLRAQGVLLSYPDIRRQRANTFGWLIGWILQETLDTAIKANILTKTKNGGGSRF